MSRTTHNVPRQDMPLAEAVLPDGSRVAVVSTDAGGKVQLSPADEVELRAAIAEADAGHTVPADEVLRRLPGR